MTATQGIRFGSLCSGIEAASAAWKPLGWECAYVSEIEPFPCALLAHHYPNVPNLGDMTRITDEQLQSHPVNLLVAGTPCQGFSVAGLRGGMADPRSQLAHEFLGIADRANAGWLVWENVPGVLSSWSDEATFAPSEKSTEIIGEAERARQTLEAAGYDLGPEIGAGDFEEADQTNDFDQFTSAIRELGYSLAWGILDAQYFGLAQRRERVFVVASAGDWTGPAAVLFDRESLCGNPAPCREKGARVAAGLTRGADSSGAGGYAGRRREDDTNIVGSLTPGAHPGGYNGQDAYTGHLVANCVDSHMGSGGPDDNAAQANHLVVHSLRADGFDASEDGTGRGTPIIPIDMRQASRGATMTNNRAIGSSGGAPGTGIGEDGDPSPTLAESHVPAIAFGWQNSSSQGISASDEFSPTLDKSKTPAIAFQRKYFSGRKEQGGKPSEICNTLTSAQAECSDGEICVATENHNAQNEMQQVRASDNDRTESRCDSKDDGRQNPLPELHPVAFQTRIGRNGRGQPEEIAPTLQGADAGATSDMRPCVSNGMAVRRLTPRECERLQGFSDDYTLIPHQRFIYELGGEPDPNNPKHWAADGPRYRALGNSMAVPVMRWIGERIQQVMESARAQLANVLPERCITRPLSRPLQEVNK